MKICVKHWNRRGKSPIMSILGPSMMLRNILVLLALFLAFVQPLAAHVVKQLYGEFATEGQSWKLEILFDAGYADPSTRNDAAAPQPSRDWLVNLPPADQQRLCTEAEKYLRESLSFRSRSVPLEWKVSFPDFKTQPPAFPSLLNDGAYFHALIEPSGKSGSVSVGMAGGDHPDLVVKMPAASGESSYLTVPPGGEVVLLAGQETAEGETPVVEQGQNSAAIAFHLGVKHVLGGLDHLLFVLGIFMLQRRWQSLLKQSLAFTAAHTIALGLAALGWVDVPRWIVEPVIALSITALAVENLFVSKAGPWRLWLVFAFGLIHGLGFAGALSTWIHPGEGFLPTLISANIGVEVGQIIVLFLAWSVTMGWSESKAWPHFRRWACVALVAAGLIWFAERVKQYHSSSSSGSSSASLMDESPNSISTRLRFHPFEMASSISS
jgi:hydrogenase/urease accessory protein HupE